MQVLKTLDGGKTPSGVQSDHQIARFAVVCLSNGYTMA